MKVPIIRSNNIPPEIIEQIEGSAHHEPKPQPTFGVRINKSKFYNYGLNDFKKVDYLELENGKKVTIIQETRNGKKFYKLFSLKDKVNQWIKSKLIFFNDKGKKSHIMRSGE